MPAKSKVPAPVATSSSQSIPIGGLANSVLKLAYQGRRAVLLEGETGIGKSELVAQVAADLGIACAVLDLSLLEPPDLVGLPVMKDGYTIFAPPKTLPREGAGILMLEELNRAERFIQQPALQLLTARRLHEYQLPEGWAIFAAINPDDGEYQVSPLDPALRARFLNLRVFADRAEWVKWAKSNAVHRAILSLAQHHERFLEGVPPRTWKYVSDLLKVYEANGWENRPVLTAALSGYLPDSWVVLVLDALRNSADESSENPVVILGSYHTDTNLQKKVREYTTTGRTDLLEQLAVQVMKLIDSPECKRILANNEFKIEAFETFIADLPGDFREGLQKVVVEHAELCQQLQVKPNDFLKGSYSGSTSKNFIDTWLKSSMQSHRVGLVVSALCQEISNHTNVTVLKQNGGVLDSLAHFANQIRNKKDLLKKLEDTITKFGIPVKWKHR